MKKHVLCCLLALFSFALPAAGITISGYISDEETGETLINATVYDSISGKGAVSNLYGFYTLRCPKGRCILSILIWVINLSALPSGPIATVN